MAQIDRITSNPTQSVFECYDPDIFVYEKAVEFVGICPMPRPRPIVLAKLDRNFTSNTESRVIKKLAKNMFKIITNGYHQVMSISICFGGNIPSGYIDEIVARNTMEGLITVILI